jgi:two-component system response regulator AtoC
MSNFELPALDHLARLDPSAAAEVRSVVERLASAAAAVGWAQARVAALVEARTPGGILHVLVSEAKELTSAPEVWAVRLEPGRRGRRVTVQALVRGGSVKGVPAPREISGSVVGRVVDSGKPEWTDDAGADARFSASQSVQALSLRSVGCLPIGAHAVLYLHDQEPGRFGTEHRMRLGALCQLAGRVLDAATAERSTPSAPAVHGMIGSTPAMHEVLQAIGAFAPMPWPALVVGETGTGKELVARALHSQSPRRELPFVAVNCGAIPDELAESTLFGHERGSFTGAERRKEGLLERVGEGTLFLDEVGELSARAQVKLLRTLEVGTFERIGGTRELQFQGRVVAATLRPLDRPDERGDFREDLYHRLAGCIIRVPPLRERRADVPHLAVFLLDQALGELPGDYTLTLSQAAVAELSRRQWSGNVRQLKNVIRYAVARALSASDEVIDPVHLAPAPTNTGQGNAADLLGISDLQGATQQFQQSVVFAAIEAEDGNRTRAAARLGVSRQWLHRLVSRWGVDKV